MKLHSIFMTCAFLCVAFVSQVAFAETYIVGSSSEVTFFVHHPLHEVVGVSKEPRGEVEFSPSSISDFSGFLRKPIQVDWKSFDSDNENRDGNIRSFVKASQYPTITVALLSMDATSVEGSLVQGQLKGRMYVSGAKKDFEAPFKLDVSDPKAIVGFTEIRAKLTDFGIEPPSLLLVKTKDDFEMQVRLILQPK